MARKYRRIAACASLIAALGTAVSAQTVLPGLYFPPSAWNLTLPAASRFIVLSNFNNLAVLDLETGLVWERHGGDINADGVVNIGDLVLGSLAAEICARRTTGGRMGWRLPFLQEIQTLMDPGASATEPSLPPGHPFGTPVIDDFYWTSSTRAFDDRIWLVTFRLARVNSDTPNAAHYLWCVRGPASTPKY